MEYYTDMNNETYSCADSIEQRRLMRESKKMDRGYNVIYRLCPNKKGVMKSTPIDIYTSSSVDSNIRDAETGTFYPHLVGSMDEDLYFKVILATGECRSRNGSNTLFYLSPRHYMTHLNCEISQDVITQWEEKRNARVKAKNTVKQNKVSVLVK